MPRGRSKRQSNWLWIEISISLLTTNQPFSYSWLVRAPKEVFPVPVRPSLAALVVGLIPFTAVCFSVALWDRVEPMVLGLPFNLFWLVLWIVLTPVVMGAAYRIETARRSNDIADPGKGDGR